MAQTSKRVTALLGWLRTVLSAFTEHGDSARQALATRFGPLKSLSRSQLKARHEDLRRRHARRRATLSRPRPAR